MEIHKELIKDFVIKWCLEKEGKDKEYYCRSRINSDFLNKQAEIASKITDEFINANGGKLIILKAPTGSGKTEILSSIFLSQWRINKWFAGRLYWVEPTHALLSQMKSRLELYAKIADLHVDEDHGDVLNKTFLYTAPITLTTIDSLVYGYIAKRVETWIEREGFETGRYTLPAGLIMNSLIILDEAHLIQDEVFLGPRVLSHVLCSIVNAGGLVILSTATLPTAIKNELTKCVERNAVIEYNFNGFRERKINLHRDYINKQLTDFVKEGNINCNESSIIILNTIERAQVVYKTLHEKCGENVLLIHSLMTRGDKERIYEKLRKANSSVILVGTQAIEVGIDLNIDNLYTEISPIDSLIQRIGRVGRHSGSANVYIFSVENELPYHKKLIEDTKDILSDIDKIDFNNVDKVTEVIDKVYTENVIKELSEKGDMLYLRSIEYLEQLHLFAYPPDEGEFLIRPSFYIELFIYDPNSNMCESKGDELICDFDYVRNNIVKFSISEINDYSRIRLVNLLGRLSNEIYVIHKIERKNNEIKIHFIKIKPKEQIIQRLVDEYSLIAIPKKYGDYEVYIDGEGLNYELLKGGEETIEAMVQRGRRSRRSRR
ncbi:MAG: CRISPR-associated helicase Cas3' [Vulcanisaeta sp.]|nr:CRISPR-associated helicase Cas3' [Vulcanisaeta sp.]